MFNTINYIGISDNLPTGIRFFREELFSTDCIIREDVFNIRKIISVCIDTNIVSMKLINTPTKCSNEGQKLMGKKLRVELELSYKIKYLSDSKDNCLYMVKHKDTKAMYIVLPQKINEENIEELLRNKKVAAQVFVEDLYAKARSEKQIYLRNLVLINLYIKEYLR